MLRGSLLLYISRSIFSNVPWYEWTLSRPLSLFHRFCFLRSSSRHLQPLSTVSRGPPDRLFIVSKHFLLGLAYGSPRDLFHSSPDRSLTCILGPCENNFPPIERQNSSPQFTPPHRIKFTLDSTSTCILLFLYSLSRKWNVAFFSLPSLRVFFHTRPLCWMKASALSPQVWSHSMAFD